MEKQRCAGDALSALLFPPAGERLQPLYLLWITAQLSPGTGLSYFAHNLMDARIRLVRPEQKGCQAIVQAYVPSEQMLVCLSMADNDQMVSAQWSGFAKSGLRDIWRSSGRVE